MFVSAELAGQLPMEQWNSDIDAACPKASCIWHLGASYPCGAAEGETRSLLAGGECYLGLGGEVRREEKQQKMAVVYDFVIGNL